MGSGKARTSASFCSTCGERIVWAKTGAGANQALDHLPNPLGSVWAFHDATGWRARAYTGPKVHPLEKVYMPHAATCTGSPAIEDPPDGEDR